jgi:hypothetical protein
MVDAAEEQSQRTCEVCGEHGCRPCVMSTQMAGRPLTLRKCHDYLAQGRTQGR